MKKILFIALFIFCATLSSLQVQGQLKWFDTKENFNDSQVYAYLGEYSRGYGFVFTFPTQKMFSNLKYGIAVRYFNADMDEFVQLDLPGENIPPFLALRSFGNYIVVYGTGEEKNQQKGEARVIFLDEELKEVSSKILSLGGNRYIWPESPHAYLSKDSTHLIVDIVEQCIPDKPSMIPDPVIHHFSVFNTNLEIVWEGDIELKKIFRDKSTWQCSYDFTPDKQFLIIGSEVYENKEYLVAYTIKDAEEPAVKLYSELVSTNNSLISRYMITPQNDLIMIAYTVYGEVITELTFIRKNLSNDTEIVKKKYKLDKTFETSFPVYAKKVKQFPYLRFMFRVNDGVVAFGEYFSQMMGYSIRSITMLKFDLDGEIQWIKMLEKEIYVQELSSKYLFSAFQSGDDIILFYNDFPENVKSETFKAGPKITLLSIDCMAMARINSSGEIVERKILNTYKQSVTYNDLQSVYQVDPDRFIFLGECKANNAFSIYTLE
jgi:hypothetical protein